MKDFHFESERADLVTAMLLLEEAKANIEKHLVHIKNALNVLFVLGSVHTANFDPMIEDLPFSKGAKKWLKKEGFIHLGDLSKKSEKELLALPGSGCRLLNEIKNVLASQGVTLDMRTPSWNPEG